MRKYCIFVFNLQKGKEEIIRLSDSFFKKYYKYLKDNCMFFSVEDFVSFYFMNKGYKVERNYMKRLEKGYPDLKVLHPKFGECFIEVKSLNDNVKFTQIGKLLKLNALIYWVVPIDYDNDDVRNLEDVMY